MRYINIVLLSFLFVPGGYSANEPNKDYGLMDSNHTNSYSLGGTRSDSILSTGWYRVVDSIHGFKRQLDKTSQHYFIDPNPITTTKNFKYLKIYAMQEGGFGLLMQFDDIGTSLWNTATNIAQQRNQRLAFILNDTLLHVPLVVSQITGGVAAINRNDYSRSEIENIKKLIEAER